MADGDVTRGCACALRHVAALRARHQTRRCRRPPRPSPMPRASPSKCSWLTGTRQGTRSMIRILTGVKVRHAACGAILRQITASKGSKGVQHTFFLSMTCLCFTTRSQFLSQSVCELWRLTKPKQFQTVVSKTNVIVRPICHICIPAGTNAATSL